MFSCSKASDANIANIVCLWKTRLYLNLNPTYICHLWITVPLPPTWLYWIFLLLIFIQFKCLNNEAEFNFQSIWLTLHSGIFVCICNKLKHSIWVIKPEQLTGRGQISTATLMNTCGKYVPDFTWITILRYNSCHGLLFYQYLFQLYTSEVICCWFHSFLGDTIVDQSQLLTTLTYPSCAGKNDTTSNFCHWSVRMTRYQIHMKLWFVFKNCNIVLKKKNTFSVLLLCYLILVIGG